MYTDSEITAISAGGGRCGTLYKAVLYLAIPLSIFVTLLSMYRHPWAYAQILSTGAAVAVGAEIYASCGQRNLTLTITDKWILSQNSNQDNNRLTDALIYTSTANRTRIFRARSG
ncbi:LptF/LptG family permease [Shigella flexneri]